MSRTLTLECGCRLVVARTDAKDTPTATRLVAERGRHCCRRNHVPGARLYLWELLPDLAGRREAVTSGIEWF